LSIVIQTET